MIPVADITRLESKATASAGLWWVDRAGPELSARDRLTRRQIGALGAILVLVAIGAIVAPKPLAIVLVAVTTAVYLGTLVHRLWVFRLSMRTGALVRVSDELARAVPDDELPRYTVLVPAYREPEVIAGLVAALERLEYPRDRLEVKLLLEEGDDETLAAAQAVRTELPVTVLIVPEGSPRTKPRALNYGLMWSGGELVTIYDAEDRPEPLQLRRAAVAMDRLPDDVACLQARLEFDDSRRNVLARLFSVEYLTWFRCFLPGLAASGGVLPLGGTSNHFRRRALVQVGAWDPFNVTEDADLGIRLQRCGYRVGVLDSVTVEEVNSDTINWIKQRSRWQKGYLQTALVHLRHPVQLGRELGWRGLLHLLLFVAGTPMLALCNLVFWSMTLAWGATQSQAIEAIFPGVLFYLAIGCWLIGNLAIFYLGVVTVVEVDRPDLASALVLTPLYWVLMSIASLRAVIQLVVDPFHWEKTAHGLANQGDGGPGGDSVVPTEPEATGRQPVGTPALASTGG